jgi:hypothetical protein
MRLVFGFFCVLGVLLTSVVAQAGGKVALVIGNGAYQNATALPNPSNDASDIAAKLQELGFTVIGGNDLDYAAMGAKIGEFEDASRDADVTLLFYAGHGMQVNGRNFLVPTNAKLERESSLQFEAIDAETILRSMSGPGKTAIALLDACRDNPLSRRFARSLGTRSTAVPQGLAVPAVSGGGILIGFATSPGDVAADGEGRNSPFTTALLKHLAEPGVEIQQVMTRVKRDVFDSTKSNQEPWHNSSLRSEVYLGGEAQATAPEPQKPAEPQADPVAAQWNAIKDTDSLKILEAFIAQNPQNPVYVLLAEERIARIKEKAAPAEEIKLSGLNETPSANPDALPPLEELQRNQNPPAEVQGGNAALVEFFKAAKDANDGNSKFALLNVGVRNVALKAPSKNPGNKSQSFALKPLVEASGIDELRQKNPSLAYDPAVSTRCRLDWIDRCPWIPAETVKALADTMAGAGMDINYHEGNYYVLTPLRDTSDYVLSNAPAFGSGQQAVIAAIVSPSLEVKGVYGFELDKAALGIDAGDPTSIIELTGALANGDDLYVSLDSGSRCTDKPRRFGFVARFSQSTGALAWVSPTNTSDANLILTEGKLFAASGGSCIDDYFYMLNPDTGQIFIRAKMPSAIDRMDVRDGNLVMELYDRAAVYSIP